MKKHTKETIKNQYNLSNTDLQQILVNYEKGIGSFPLSKKYNIPNGIIINWLKLNNIYIRSIKESRNLDYQKNYEKTIMKKYGVKNISQIQEIKNKKKATFKKRYGVSHNFLIPQVKEKRLKGQYEYYNDEERLLKTYTKIKQTFKEKYGVENASQIERVIKIISKKAKERFKNKTLEERREITLPARMSWDKQNTWESKIEQRIQKILDDNKISYNKHCFIYGFNYDIVLPKYKIIIEVQGDFWHANPLKYKSSDIIYNGKTKAKDIWDKDKRKKQIAISKNWKYIVLWEFDINKMSDKQLIDYINKNIKGD